MRNCNEKFMNITHRLDFIPFLWYNKNVENQTVVTTYITRSL